MNTTYAEINLRNLISNYNSIRKQTKTKVMAVVKADAYGHGLIECASALSKLKNKPEYYGVALLEEAIQLRIETKIKEPILCFAPIDLNNLTLYIKYNVIPTISTGKSIKKLVNLKQMKKLKVHININTGMNRLGIHYSDVVNEIKKLAKSEKIIIDGLYTHFATSDEKNKEFAELQLERFNSVLLELKKENINYGLAHAANSGAILDMPNTYFDMVRPGISLYGYYPSLETTESIKLEPVMSLFSKISTISSLTKGDTVGYGRHFTSKKMSDCATLPIGYADGLVRGLSNKISVIIGDKLFPQIGRISMDRININLFNETIREKSNVTLLGKSKTKQITAWDWSIILDTIPYEITCNISKRVKRKYVGKIH